MTDETATGQTGKKPAFFSRAKEKWAALSPFSRAFAEGIAAGAVVIALLFVWMSFRADRTLESVQAHIPGQIVSLQMFSPMPSPVPDPQESNTDINNMPVGEAPDVAAPTESAVPVLLPPAPLDGMVEMKRELVLPVIRFADDLTPFNAYKRPFTRAEGRNIVAVVITDFGLSQAQSAVVLEAMPAEVTLAVSPYGAASAAAKTARAAGHETWISLPMETRNAMRDPGPLAFRANAPLDENLRVLQAVLSSAAGYAGVISQREHAFNDSSLDISPLTSQIFGRGLAFAESNPGVAAVGLSYAMEHGHPYVQNNFWIGDDLRPKTIAETLAMVEEQAAAKGKAVLFVEPYPALITALSQWMKEADQRHIQFAPLSAVTAQ